MKVKIPGEQQVFRYACQLLVRRNYSRAELLGKFKTKFISDESIFEKVFTKLKKMRLQSDEIFAETFVRSRENWGARRISIELKKRGIADELIETFLPSEVSEIENARSVLVRKMRGKKIPTEYSKKRKLAAFLARRGFSLDAIRKVLKLD